MQTEPKHNSSEQKVYFQDHFFVYMFIELVLVFCDCILCRGY